MNCPKCGNEMKTCCELYNEFMEKYKDKDPTLYQVGHFCGPSEWVCQKCGCRKYKMNILEEK